MFAPMLKSAPTPSAQEEHDAVGRILCKYFRRVFVGPLTIPQGVLNHFFPPSADSTPTHCPVPVNILVTGSVPSGSGLSSSAAMVVASTLAFLAVNDKLSGLTKGQLVEMAMSNEKRVGVNSGGMDQAASVISMPHSALYITFFPTLSAEPIPLPTPRTLPRAVFICSNSLVVSDKVVGAKTHYNLRVVETLVGARVLALHLGLKLAPSDRPTFREVLGRWLEVPEEKGGPTLVDPDALRSGLERILVEAEKLRPSDVVDGQGPQFHELYLSWVDVEAEHFQLYKRAKHVFSEALRVLQFRDVCLRAEDTKGALPERTLAELAGRADATCARCGCLRQPSDRCGVGRLRVSLVAEDAVDEFIAKIKATYAPYKNLEGDALHEVIFATKPSGGAFVYRMS
ncbi:Galactokinase [Grifola frondosa]|uniref:Galactokinase n=1 Tax=Grifola frondosa TaxID=5627 RepID=A0A1C7LQH6_GRIFR|nr:Galactokinase [Grifola frondosa]